MSDNKQNLCPCGSGLDYDSCCGPLHQGKAQARTAEALMRSRYAAFAKNNFEYLAQTLHPDTTNEHDTEQNRELYKQFAWQGLEILGTEQGGENDEQGYVDFIARYNVANTPHAIREKSLFHKINGAWLYVEGKSLQVPPTAPSKVGRNDPCPCGSGKKYKKCCMT